MWKFVGIVVVSLLGLVSILQIKKTLEWAELFGSAPREVKQMIILNIIDRVTVGRGYKIDVKLKLTAQQFLEPNVPEKIPSAS